MGTLSHANLDKPKVIDSIPTLTEKVFLSPKTLSSQSGLSLPREISDSILKETGTVLGSGAQDSLTDTLSQHLQSKFFSANQNDAEPAEQLQTSTDKMPVPSDTIENLPESPNLAPTFMSLPKTFEPQPIEERWYQTWQSAGRGKMF